MKNITLYFFYIVLIASKNRRRLQLINEQKSECDTTIQTNLLEEVITSDELNCLFQCVELHSSEDTNPESKFIYGSGNETDTKIRLISHDHTYIKYTGSSEIAENTTSSRKLQQKRAPREVRPSHNVRYDQKNHSIIKTSGRTRCKYEGCSCLSQFMCSKCNVHLCYENRNCAEKFHNIG